MVSVLVVVLAGICLATWTVDRSFPEVDGVTTLPGLSADVEVTRDRWGVPEIYADTSDDLFAAQGYVHAQDRFFEMDFRRHVTSGRLSEMFGKSQVETDRAIRTMGWRRVAAAEWKLLDAKTRRYFTAYTRGVNAYLKGKSPGDVSLEYSALGLTGLDYRIERWDPVDSLAWLKAMAWDLKGNYDDELGRARLAGSGLSADEIADIYPPYPGEHADIVGSGTVRDGAFDPSAKKSSVSPRVAATDAHAAGAVERASDSLAPLTKLMGPGADAGIGSNSWVISGDYTTTGKPLLSNDPHLGAAMPSVWYQVGLRCREVSAACPFDVTGFSFSGVPGVMIGHNAHVAWGFTNLGPDVTDFYLERIRGKRYEVDGKWHRLRERTETIKVAGGEPVRITVRSTGHGPLVSDSDPAATAVGNHPPEGPGRVYGLALQWTALRPGRTAEAIFSMDTAESFADFRDGARRFEVPAQNLIFADDSGNIGYQSPGRIPVRGKGDGTMPVPGWDSSYDWKGYIPFDELPYVSNPDEGFIVTANNRVIGDQYPYLLTKDWTYGYRSQRIRDMISEAPGKISVADIAKMHMDTTNTGAAAVEKAIRRLGPVSDCAGCGVLRKWDLRQDAGSAGAAMYNATWRHLLSDVFDELPADMAPGGGERWSYVVERLASQPHAWWWDDKSTPRIEDRDDMLRKALRQASDELVNRLGDDPADWRWGDLHTLTVRNQSLGTSGIGLVEAIFNARSIPTGGGGGIVDATGWDTREGYAVTALPSMRMIVDLSDLDGSRWINLTGNSGHAGHTNYADQLPLWNSGRLLPMNWSRQKLDAAQRHRLVLRP